MAAGMTDEEAVAQAYGKSFAEFEADWQAELKKPRAKAVSQKAVRPSVAKKLVFKEDAKGRAEPPPWMRGRGRAPGSGGKARRTPGRDPLCAQALGRGGEGVRPARQRVAREVPHIARRYAFAQMQLGRFPEAEEALRSAVERDPTTRRRKRCTPIVLVSAGRWTRRACARQRDRGGPLRPRPARDVRGGGEGLKDPALEERERKAVALSAGGRTS